MDYWCPDCGVEYRVWYMSGGTAGELIARICPYCGHWHVHEHQDVSASVNFDSALWVFWLLLIVMILVILALIWCLLG